MFELPELKYKYTDLEPYIDAQTMEIHYSKHHQGYVNNLNKALENHPELSDKSVEELLQELNSLPEDIQTAVRNNGGGHYNHSLFWNIMSPNPQTQPSDKLLEMINRDFGSIDKLNRIFPNSVLFNQYFLGAENLDIPHEIDLCIAHFMLLRKSVMQEIGNWDEDFFVYGEDVDYCYRIKQAGWKIMYLPQWQATHYKGVGVGVRRETRDITKASEETKKNMQKQTTHAMKLFYAKHYKDKYPFFITGFVLFGIFLLNKLRGKKG